MADGLLPINFVVNEKKLAFSETNPRAILLPSFSQEDIIPIRFKALKRTSDTFPFLEKINLTGYSLTVVVGRADDIMASATPGDFDLAENNTALEGELNLNTSDIDTALGAASSVALTFEIILTTATAVYRMAQEIVVRASVSLAGALVPVAGDTALGRLEAQRTYAPMNDCHGIIFIDSVTGERMMLRITNGAPALENVT